MKDNKPWRKEEDEHLRENYNDVVHVSPFQIALRLGRRVDQVINRLLYLGLRNKRKMRKEY